MQFDLIWGVKVKFQFEQDPRGEGNENWNEEDWDAEVENDPVRSYNPLNKIYNSDKPILFNIQGKSKAEKREVRARQKAKFIGGQHEAFQDRDDGPYFH